MKLNDKIYVAGHSGLVGSAIMRKLKNQGFSNIIVREHKDLDLTNQTRVNTFFQKEKPNHVILAAAKVGGIYANRTYPADFIYQNIMISANIINAAFINNVQRLLFLGSTCIYPKHTDQPIREDALLTGTLEKTNEPYAVAKIAGIKICESYNRQHSTDFRSIMPTNIYGINDNFHPENSHVIPSLIRRIHHAKIKKHPEVIIWGTGKAKREFLYVDDMADASLHVLKLNKEIYLANTKPSLSHINIGTGKEILIKDLATIISEIIGFKGKLKFDTTKPDGPTRKLSDTTCLTKIGWKFNIELLEGLKRTYKWYIGNYHEER